MIDDLVDSGETAKIVKEMMPNSKFVVLYAKTSGKKQADLHLYDFNNSSTYSYWNIENVCTVSNQSAGVAGSGVHTVASASDGVEIYGSSGGTFINGASAILYKVT